MRIPFCKYQGAGNDFILIDNRKKDIVLSESQIIFLCHRHFGIGADGLMLLETDEQVDFSMHYFNADGREVSMCGNGGRCTTAFALRLGIFNDRCDFRAVDGVHSASITVKSNREATVSLQMNDAHKVLKYQNDYFLDTGVPHVVRFVASMKSVDVCSEGRAIRYSEDYAPNGTNVNFVEILPDGLYVRTYERGVEDETMACGTGSVASAIAASLEKGLSCGPQIWKIDTPGGKLEVSFVRKEDIFTKVFLAGPATLSFEGVVEIDK